MDLDRRSLKAERLEVAAQGLGILGVSQENDTARLTRGGEHLPGNGPDFCRIERQGLADEVLGHDAGELRRPVEIALVSLALFGPELHPARNELGRACLSTVVLGLGSDRPGT